MDPLVLSCTPFAEDMNYGRACNEVMALLPEGAWAAIMDHDMMHTTPRWHAMMLRAIAAEPEGSFTAVTNRIASPWQQAPEAREIGDDVVKHRLVGAGRLTRTTLLDVTDTQGWGGVVMLISKDAWRAAGGFVDGMFCVDHMMHYALKAVGRRVWLIEGLYVYHVRGSSTDRETLRSAPKARDRAGVGCPCRQVPNVKPTTRRDM
jgi:GT2 family glycosyltransferase